MRMSGGECTFETLRPVPLEIHIQIHVPVDRNSKPARRALRPKSRTQCTIFSEKSTCGTP